METNYILTVQMPEDYDGPTLGEQEICDAISEQAEAVGVTVAAVSVERQP